MSCRISRGPDPGPVPEVPAALDIQLRALGLRRAAEESLPAYSPEVQSIFQAYADGVNAYLGDESNELPPEYAQLELNSMEPWTVLESVTIAKGLAFQLSFDIGDIDRTLTLEAYQEAGESQGFDGTALFFEDLFRSAPFDPSVSIPDFFADSNQSVSPSQRITTRSVPRVRDVLRPATLRMIRRYRDKIRSNPFLNQALGGDRRTLGSNWWLIDGDHSESGVPLIANDPHLDLTTLWVRWKGRSLSWFRAAT
ncbi:MAG: penicillin acylase family protein, partial [Acidobacteriota bacterium]